MSQEVAEQQDTSAKILSPQRRVSTDSETAASKAQVDFDGIKNGDLPSRLKWVEEIFYKPHETDIEWLHRKAFLVAHTSKYPLNRLRCLAACYVNSVVHGCRYHDSVMEELQSVEPETLKVIDDLMKANKLRSRELRMKESNDDYIPTTNSSNTLSTFESKRRNKQVNDNESREDGNDQAATKRPRWFDNLKPAQ